MKISLEVRHLPLEAHIAHDFYRGGYTIFVKYEGLCKTVTGLESLVLLQHGHEPLRAAAYRAHADLVRQREALDKVIARLKGTDRPSSSI